MKLPIPSYRFCMYNRVLRPWKKKNPTPSIFGHSANWRDRQPNTQPITAHQCSQHHCHQSQQCARSCSLPGQTLAVVWKQSRRDSHCPTWRQVHNPCLRWTNVMVQCFTLHHPLHDYICHECHNNISEDQDGYRGMWTGCRPDVVVANQVKALARFVWCQGEIAGIELE